MQTQAHTQAALQAQLDAEQAQERANMWWSSMLRTRFEDGTVERGMSSGGRDGAVLGGKEGFVEEASSSVPEAGEKEGGTSVTATSRSIGKLSGTFSVFP
ncbi:hypothetical protein Taro_043796 [Colocasia esculenta]|uniref:Uncharacterized protein n=1 Tax=Colocasia esculenta TaxID=4460 RepID=A0A843WSA8_COLES|nr:hypothetical protein [Colocasia esculenta]